MIRIAVCDDNPSDLQSLCRKLKGCFPSGNAEIRAFRSADALIRAKEGFDAVFLDVRMRGTDGFSAARTLRARGDDCKIVFVSVARESVFSAFETEAFDFLVKPLQKPIFERTIARLKRCLLKKKQHIALKQDGKIIRIAEGSIVWAEVLDKKLYFHLRDNSTVCAYGKLDDLAGRLSERFFRPHRSYVINLEHLRSFDGRCAAMTDGRTVPVAKKRHAAFKSAVLQYMSLKNELF